MATAGHDGNPCLNEHTLASTDGILLGIDVACYGSNKGNATGLAAIITGCAMPSIDPSRP